MQAEIRKPDDKNRPIADVTQGIYFLSAGRHRLRFSNGDIVDVKIYNADGGKLTMTENEMIISRWTSD